MKLSSETFLVGSSAPKEVVGEGIVRQLLGYDDRILMAKVWFEKGAVGSLHARRHSQVTYVESGEFEVNVGGRIRELVAGDCMYIAPQVEHGALCKSKGILIDVFSPVRDDFLAGGAVYES